MILADATQLAPILSRIELILWRQGDYRAAEDFGYLTELARSGEEWDAAELERLLTQQAGLWTGMGSIPDRSFNDVSTDREFRTAYLELAQACERLGCASTYSRKLVELSRTV